MHRNVDIKPEFGPFVRLGHVADHILTETITQEEHGVLADAGHDGRGRAFVEPTQPPLPVGGHEAVEEAAVQFGERLHLHLRGVKRLTTQHTSRAT